MHKTTKNAQQRAELLAELLDVVNEHDQVIGVKTRGEIHTQGLMHRAIHALVFNAAGDLFLQKRSMNKDNNPGKWDSSAAGHLDSGEDYQNCLVREIAEELGVHINTDTQCHTLFKLPAIPATGMEHCMVYQVAHNGPFTLAEEEIDEGKWIASGAMDQRVNADDPQMTEVLKTIWKKLRAAQRENNHPRPKRRE